MPIFKEGHITLKPTIKNWGNIGNNIFMPTHSNLARKILPIIPRTRSDPWKGVCFPDDWITFDRKYKEFIQARSKILSTNKHNVIGYMDSSHNACRELFIYVITYVSEKYPRVFTLTVRNNFYTIFNKATNKLYTVDVLQENVLKLWTILSECVPTDFTILQKINGVYYVIASNSLFAINWQVSDRWGFDVIKLHGTAPGWQPGEMHYKNYVSFFDKVNSGQIFKRVNLFVINTPKLFIPTHKPRTPLSGEIGNTVGYRLEDLYLRRELQTFHLLPISNLIVFGVQTFVQRLDTLTNPELLHIKEYVCNWNDYTANYHDRGTWLPVIIKYLKDNNV